MRPPKPRRRPQADYRLLFLTGALLVFGVLMLYSASAILADLERGDSLYFVKRQILWAGFGLAAMTLFARLNYNRLREWVWPALGLTGLALLAVLFTHPVAGARRWIRIGPVGIQPAEFAKLALVLFLADYLDRKRSKLGLLLQGIVVPWVLIGLILGLIALEPDIGTPALLFTCGVMMVFLGGSRLTHIAAACGCAMPMLAYELARFPYRRRRILNFLNPFDDPQGAGYQLVQSIVAVGSGGWLGKGLGSSQLKLMHLPTPHTDFIFSILAEELGLAGSFALLVLFTALLMRGMRIARAAPNLFGTLLAAGITLVICLQAYGNIAMALGLLPTKGLPLPFFSYGGSSLLVTLSGIGILMNISAQAEASGAFRRRC